MLVLIGVTALLVCVVLCYSLYKSGFKDIIKMVSLPLTIALAVLMGIHYSDSLGKPLERKPEGTWNYIHHVTDGETIELWAQNDSGSRLYVFPYNDETREQLDKAKGKQQEGYPVEGEFTSEEQTDEERGANRTPPNTLTIKVPDNNRIKGG